MLYIQMLYAEGDKLIIYKLHLWLLLNSALALALYFNVSGIKFLIFPLSFAFGFLLKTKAEIKDEYTTAIDWKVISISALLLLALIISAFTVFTKRLNENLVLSTEVAAISFAALLIIVYFFRLKYELKNV